jgi:hypothetical protein
MKHAGHTTVSVHQGYDQATAIRMRTKTDAYTRSQFGKQHETKEAGKKQRQKELRPEAGQERRSDPFEGTPIENVAGKKSLDVAALRELAALFKEGLLSKEEFQAAKRAIGLNPTAG